MDNVIPRIKIEERFDPLIRGVSNGQIRYARSGTYEKLKDEIYNYTIRKTGGESVLLSGHRGAGKTTLIQNAINDLKIMMNGRRDNCRPLMIPLHGPDLLDFSRMVNPVRPNSQPPDADKKEDANTPSKTQEIEPSDGNKQIKNVLENLTISLYRALANEFYDAFQQKVKDGPRATELRELLGLFRLELDESPDVATLREFWSRAGFLKSGVLFDNRDVDQGIQEIVVLSSAAQAFRIIAGSVSDTTGLTKEAELEKIHATEIRMVSKEIINAVFALFSGIAVAVGVYASIGNKYNLFFSSLAGIASAFLANISFTWSSKTTVRKKKSKEYKFIRNTEISSLNRELPILINRVRDIGLAPIFVVDELDKVIETPFKEFGNLISYLKKLVSDNAFFCFITDRNYFDFISEIYSKNAYPKEYTYFTHRFYVKYTPGDLHHYLDELFELHNIPDLPSKADAVLMQYLLLNRANLHAIDLRREIIKRSEEGYISTYGIKSRLGYRFPILAQLAIECILEDEDLAERFEQDSYFSQLISDTLYYPLRCWMTGEKKLDISKAALIRYLLDRSEFNIDASKLNELIGKKNWADLEKEIPVSMNDIDLLTVKLNQLTELLTKYDFLFDLLNKSGKTAKFAIKYQVDGIWSTILDILPGQQGNRQAGTALLQREAADSYVWKYDYFGRSLERNLFNEKEELAKTGKKLKSLELFFRDLTAGEAGLADLATQQIIDSTPFWPEVDFTITQLTDYIDNNIASPFLESDLQNIDEFAGMIETKGQTLVKSFILASFLNDYVGDGGWLDSFSIIGKLLSPKDDLENKKIDKIFLQLEFKIDGIEGCELMLDNIQEWKGKLNILLKQHIEYKRPIDRIQEDWVESCKKKLLQHFNAYKDEFDPDIVDLICDAKNIGFSRRVYGRLSNISKSVWFTLLVEAVKNDDPTDHPGEVFESEIPEWMVIPALLKLGFYFNFADAFKISDIPWRAVLEKYTPSKENYLLIISQKDIISSALVDYSINSLEKPLFVFKEDYLDQKILKIIVITKILRKAGCEIAALIADFDVNEKTEGKIWAIAKEFKLDSSNIFRISAAPQSEYKSQFKTIRKLEELGNINQTVRE